jgi:hypothetical protein
MRHGPDDVMKGPAAWFAVAEQLCARIAAPRVDVRAVDSEVEALVRDSWLWSRGAAFASSVRAAWLASRCRRFLRWAAPST